tara:strand:- start:2226 stop:2780 length:555 start_codon:yes stop_codon:yes gene_type:complete
MKIIAGNFKSRNITVPERIRPVSLRVKKSCFDILGSEAKNLDCLDLFSGSGSLGLEALSRGAKTVVFIDSQSSALKAIRANIKALDLSRQTQAYQKDAFLALKVLEAKKSKFGLVFLDPPYYKGLITKALQALEEYDIVAPFGYIICFCYIKDDFPQSTGLFSLILEKNYGQSLLLIYQKQEKP